MATEGAVTAGAELKNLTWAQEETGQILGRDSQ